MNSSLSFKVLGGLSWSFASRVVSNISQLLIYFVLARILEPFEFGIMASLSIFINLSNMFATAGLGNANIQIKTDDYDRYSTIFYLCFFLSIVLYILIYFSAPTISTFLDVSEDFDYLLRIYALTISLTVISSMQISQLSRKLEFKKIFYCTTIPSLISGIFSIILAVYGFGIYALIANVGIARLLSICIYSFYYVSFPRLVINSKIAKESSLYSSNLFLSSLLDEMYRSSIVILIGKFYNATLLGYYNVGRQIPGFISHTINATVASVIFPVFSKHQEDLVRGKGMLRKSNRLLNIVIFPILSLILLLTDEIVVLLLTEKWLPVVIYLQLFTIILGLHHIYMSSTAYINALGHSSVTLKYNTLNKLLAFVILFLTFESGIKAIVAGQLLVVLFQLFINVVPNKVYINYSYFEQFRDFIPAFLLNLFLYNFFLYFNFTIDSLFLQITYTSFVYIVIYLIMVVIFRFKAYQDVLDLFKK